MGRKQKWCSTQHGWRQRLDPVPSAPWFILIALNAAVVSELGLASLHHSTLTIRSAAPLLLMTFGNAQLRPPRWLLVVTTMLLVLLAEFTAQMPPTSVGGGSVVLG